MLWLAFNVMGLHNLTRTCIRITEIELPRGLHLNWHRGEQEDNSFLVCDVMSSDR
jgi:hypothetical protein